MVLSLTSRAVHWSPYLISVALAVVAISAGSAAAQVAVKRVTKVEVERSGGYSIRFKIEPVQDNYSFSVEDQSNLGSWKTQVIDESDSRYEKIYDIFHGETIQTRVVEPATGAITTTGLYTNLTVHQNLGNPMQYVNVDFEWVKPLMDLADEIVNDRYVASKSDSQSSSKNAAVPDLTQFHLGTATMKYGPGPPPFERNSTVSFFLIEYSAPRSTHEEIPETTIGRNGVPHITYKTQTSIVYENRSAELSSTALEFRLPDGSQLSPEMKKKLYSGQTCNILLLSSASSFPKNLTGHFRDDLIIAQIINRVFK